LFHSVAIPKQSIKRGGVVKSPIWCVSEKGVVMVVVVVRGKKERMREDGARRQRLPFPVRPPWLPPGKRQPLETERPAGVATTAL
jgi:hypothetical protein